jgi:hypothetical protein
MPVLRHQKAGQRHSSVSWANSGAFDPQCYAVFQSSMITACRWLIEVSPSTGIARLQPEKRVAARQTRLPLQSRTALAGRQQVSNVRKELYDYRGHVATATTGLRRHWSRTTMGRHHIPTIEVKFKHWIGSLICITKHLGKVWTTCVAQIWQPNSSAC